MSQELNKRLIEQTCEIIKLKKENRELLDALKQCHEILEDGHWQETKKSIAAFISRAEKNT